MSLEIVIGPMFSGKSSYALSYVRRQRAIGKVVLVIKPDIDNRYATDAVLVTHDKEKIPCMRWNTKRPLSELSLAGYDCYVFEEAQFLTGLYDLCRELLFVLRKNILVVGLDGCAQQRKFGEILDLIPICTNVTKLAALCKQCGDGTPAVYSKKMEEHGDSQVDVGGSEKYTAVCLRHL